MSTPSEKQMKFRATLIARNIGRAKVSGTFGIEPPADLYEANEENKTDPEKWYLDVRGTGKLADLALMLALPEPESSADCSEQIESLKSGGGLSYGRSHPEWARPVNDRFVAMWPDPEARPKVMRVAEIRAIATGAGGA